MVDSAIAVAKQSVLLDVCDGILVPAGFVLEQGTAERLNCQERPRGGQWGAMH